MSPEKGHKRKTPTAAMPFGPGIAAHLRLDISGLLMDSGRFRQPPRVISPIVSSLTGWPTPKPAGPPRSHVGLAVFGFYSYTERASPQETTCSLFF
jgi:hypothetical protein